MKTAPRSNVLSSPCDCHSIPVADLDAALVFYRDGLGHELIRRDDSAAGLRLPDSDAELVLHTDERPIETDLLVASVPAAISRFVEAGGKLVAGPFEIRIGLCAMIEGPWQNRLVILRRKGLSKPIQKGMSLGVVPPDTCALNLSNYGEKWSHFTGSPDVCRKSIPDGPSM